MEYWEQKSSSRLLQTAFKCYFNINHEVHNKLTPACTPRGILSEAKCEYIHIIQILLTLLVTPFLFNYILSKSYSSGNSLLIKCPFISVAFCWASSTLLTLSFQTEKSECWHRCASELKHRAVTYFNNEMRTLIDQSQNCSMLKLNLIFEL